MLKRINGIQHVGLAVANMDEALKFYRKVLGMDVSFFDSIAAAPLMDIYTRNETITKRASMILNLQGGCAMEVISATSFSPKGPDFKVKLGDIGITTTQVKSKNIDISYDFCRSENVKILGDLRTRPDGTKTFYFEDLEGNIFQFTEDRPDYMDLGHHSGGIVGCTIGVRDIEKSLQLYSDILGFDEVVYDETGIFDDWNEMPGGNEKYRRILITQSNQPGGGFAKLSGSATIELVQALDRDVNYIFKDRIWADLGFVHLGFDVKGMKALGEELASKGFGFTCDSNDALDMGTTKVHCTYINDPDETWLEMIEVYKVPILEKWGLFLNVEKRDPLKPLPNYMLKALKFSRIKD